MGISINSNTIELFNMGSKKAALVDVTGDASYPAGGYAPDPVLFGMSKVQGAYVIGGNAAAGTVILHWDTVNSKLMIVYPTGGATASPAALAAPALTAGGAVDNNAITPGQGKQIAASTDVTSLTWRVVFIGF